MKTAKKVLLFIMGLMIVSMIILLSCKNRYTGPGDKGIFEEGSSGETGESGGGGDSGPIPLVGSGGGLIINGYTLPINSLSQEEQEQDYDPEFNSVVLFADGKIPALTTTKAGVILAAAGTSESADYIVVKRSSDMGKTWSQANVNYEGFSSMYTHPFFINCHDGGILMGVATTNATENKTIFYKSSDNGATWTKQKEIQSSDITNANLANSLVNFGQGITLRHQSDSSSTKLMFPYFYYRVETSVLKNQKRHTAIMCSTDDGANFNSVCTGFTLNKNNINGNTVGDFTTYEPKLLELADGSVLLAMFNDGGKAFWCKSTDCGAKWTFGDVNDGVGGRRLDLVRYEFDGKPIKNKETDNGDKYSLMIYSSTSGDYGIKMSTNDFNSGNSGTKYHVEKELALGVANSDGYPAITTLPDGTIATLTDEDNGVVFRRFNLYWLSDGLRNIDYATDLKYN